MTRTTRTRRLATVALAAAVGVGLLAPAASAAPPPNKSYAASVSPATVAPRGSADVTLTNCGDCGSEVRTSSVAFGSAEIRLPAGVVSEATVTRPGWTATTSVEGSRTVVSLRSTSGAVEPGQSIAITLAIAADAPDDTYSLLTAVKQSNDFSGVGNDFARVGPDPVVVVEGGGTPVAVEFVVQPSTVQSVSSPSSTTGVTPRTGMCDPAPSVRLVDADGDTVTSSQPVSITLTPAAADPGLSGPLVASTVEGVATFGDCDAPLRASVLGRDFTLRATATGLAADTSATFDVLQTYGSCDGPCAVGATQGPTGTTAGMSAAPGGASSGVLTFAVGQTGDRWTAAEQEVCDPDPGGGSTLNPYRDVVTVDLTGYDKTVELRWSKQAVQWATNNGSSQWRVCLAAEAPFAAEGGTSTQVGDWFVGTLLACGDPALADDDPCVQSLRRQGGDQLATVSIPDRPGDPRMI